MIEGGLAIFLIGALLSCLAPVERAVSQRRWQHTGIVQRPPLAAAYRLAPPDPSLDRLARVAEAALDEDDLARAVRQIGAVYDASAKD